MEVATKRQLPAPYSYDWTGIVTRVKGRRDSTRSALVNSVKVASYVKAGSNLIERTLGPSGDSESATPSDVRPYWSGLRFLTQQAIIDEVAKLKPPFVAQKGDGPFRATWVTHDDYINDLLTFFFHPINYDFQYGAETQTRGSWIIETPSFADAVDRTCFHELLTISTMPLFRLQIMMAASARENDAIRGVITENYQAALEPWRKIYAETFAARGLQLRPGVTLPELTTMLAAVMEGFAIRHLGDRAAGIVGSTPPGNLVGKAVLGILHSYLEPAGKIGSRTLRDEFDDICRPRAD